MINAIIFRKTSDPMISIGIIGLYKYCQKRKKGKNDIEFEISDNHLIIKSKNLEEALEELYYSMGRDYYDTSTRKQLDKKEGFYYDEIKNEFIRFPKVKTKGMANLIHDAQPTPLEKCEKLIDIENKNHELYQQILDYSGKNKTSLGKKVWINNRNTATPKIEKMNIEKGTQQCAICGESYKRAYESSSFSPFIGGSSAQRNFVSMAKGTEKICWKCIYLQRFSPVYTFFYYHYKDSKNYDMNVFIFNSNSLLSTEKMYSNLLRDLFNTKNVLIEDNYSHNFNIYNFGKSDNKIYFNLYLEQFLLLLYTIYMRIQKQKKILVKTELDDLFTIEHDIEYNTDVFYFQAKKYASTMRPVSANNFNKMHYVFQLFRSIDENDKLDFYSFLLELLIAKDEKKMKIDRAILRNEWAEKVLSLKSTIITLEKLVWNNFTTNDFHGSFKNIIEWLKMYESKINYGGNAMMNDEIRDLAIKLGNQIGFAAKSDKNPTAGKGRLISMKKSRTLTKFLDQLISFQSRYNLVFNKEILSMINESNFDYFRQFTIISALNSFNYSKGETNKTDGGTDGKNS